MPSVFRWAAGLRAAARPGRPSVRPAEADVATNDDVPVRVNEAESAPEVDRHPTASPLAHQIHHQIEDQ